MGGRGASSGASKKGKVNRPLTEKERFLEINGYTENNVTTLKTGDVVTNIHFTGDSSREYTKWTYDEGFNVKTTSRVDVTITDIKVGKKTTTIKGWYDEGGYSISDPTKTIRQKIRYLKKTFKNDELVMGKRN